MAAPTTIDADSPLWTALRDLNTTTYLAEGGCNVTRSRFLATALLFDCIAVFASSPGYLSFGAHINTRTLLESLDDVEVRGRGGLPVIAKWLQVVFGDVDPSQVHENTLPPCPPPPPLSLSHTHTHSRSLSLAGDHPPGGGAREPRSPPGAERYLLPRSPTRGHTP